MAQEWRFTQVLIEVDIDSTSWLEYISQLLLEVDVGPRKVTVQHI